MIISIKYHAGKVSIETQYSSRQQLDVELKFLMGFCELLVSLPFPLVADRAPNHGHFDILPHLRWQPASKDGSSESDVDDVNEEFQLEQQHCGYMWHAPVLSDQILDILQHVGILDVEKRQV